MRLALVTVATLAWVQASILVPAEPSAAAERPNIIVIMADDFGYECVGADGGTSYRTPNLDRLAATGMRFDHCFAQPLCTPTRVQIMTGQYNVRNYIEFGLLPAGQITFANLLRDAGYATSIVGKWQLANGLEGPRKFGFDDHCLWHFMRRMSRYANPGLEINGREMDYTHGEYGPDIVNDHAIEFVSDHRQGPFLLYYPMMLTHSPYQPTPDSPAYDKDAKGEKVDQEVPHFCEMVEYTDKLIGKLVARLDELGIRERTLILFTGDNGTGRGTTSRMGDMTVVGGKGSMTDQGMRVPLIVNWQGTIAPGVSDALVDMTDILPTVCDAAGIAPSAELTLDGHSLWPRLTGDKGWKPREWTYCWYAPNQNKRDVPRWFARDHKYKLFGDGSFYEVDTPHFTETKLDADKLTSQQAAARDRLAAVLARFEHARPKELEGK